MKPSIAIITPCSRPQNLMRMEFPIERGFSFAHITWYIIYDSHLIDCDKRTFVPKKGCHYQPVIDATEDPLSAVGNAQNNMALEMCKPDDWCFFLSDDNVIHPAFWANFARAIEEHPNANIIIYAQQLQGEGIRPVAPAMVHTETIDLAQFVIKRSLIGDTRFNLPRYQSDGQLIEECFAKPQANTVFLPKVLCFYNRLKW